MTMAVVLTGGLLEDVKFPSRISDKAKSLLAGLLCKDPTVRLGGQVDDAKNVMAHQFFENTNWDDIYHKRIKPPFKPVIKSETDVSNFDEDFTSEPVRLTPPEDHLARIAEDEEDTSFEKFTYIPNSNLTS
ncbi:RAC-gamma serine/threonine-protein kinase [Exaiptasia diaphana]|nr:RAC-gamma serine/threonine-protein kinase [Exaiptasia diaphana]